MSRRKPAVSTGNVDFPLVYLIARQDVEAGFVDELHASLSQLVATSEAARQTRGQLRLLFQGYDDDPRELRRIPEVRRYVSRLDAVFPYWFFVADLRSDTLQLLATCLCRTSEVAPGRVEIDLQDFDAFLRRQFAGLNELWEAASLSPEENVRTTQRIVEYFRPK